MCDNKWNLNKNILPESFFEMIFIETKTNLYFPS